MGGRYNLEGPAEVDSGKLGSSSELLFNTEKLIVLGQTLGAARSSGLDLSGAETDDEVSDEAILGLAGAVGDHGSPACKNPSNQ